MQAFLINLGLFFCITLLLHTAITLIVRHTLKKLSTKNHPWAHQAFQTARLPLLFLIWILYTTFLLHKVLILSTVQIDQWDVITLEKMQQLTSIACFVWFSFSYIGNIETIFKRKIYQQKNYDLALIHGLAKIARLIISLMTLLVVLNSLGISIASLATIGGIGAAGIAFAAKGVIGNFLGGLLLYINRSFSVGERISSPDRQIEGTVEEIGWMLTSVRDADQRPIYIPNGIFTDIILINLSRMTHLRITTDIGLRYEDASKIEAIVQDIKALVATHPELDQSQTNFVGFNKLLDSSLNINLNLYTTTTVRIDFMAIQQKILLEIMHIIESHGAACAFPSRTLYFEP